MNSSGRSQVAVFTGGQDPHYAHGLVLGLIQKGISIDVIGNELTETPEWGNEPRARYLRLYPTTDRAGLLAKVTRLLFSYLGILKYAASSPASIFHILWNGKLEFFDRTLLMLYYKGLGKRIVLTAHNVNAGRRDARDSWLNRFSLRVQYGLADHIFVHTEKMKQELLRDFHVRPGAITVVPYGINNAVPNTEMTSAEARGLLGIRDEEKTILFYGAIKRYKGLEFLLSAFENLMSRAEPYRLIIAGEPKKNDEEYFAGIQNSIAESPYRASITRKLEFIPDAETELYFKAADLAVLPYTEIFQSGILFLAYSFGLPVVASDVGSFPDDVVEGQTGLICRARDSESLAATLQKYFESSLYGELDHHRQTLREHFFSTHSWDTVAGLTREVYLKLEKEIPLQPSEQSTNTSTSPCLRR